MKRIPTSGWLTASRKSFRKRAGKHCIAHGGSQCSPAWATRWVDGGRSEYGRRIRALAQLDANLRPRKSIHKDLVVDLSLYVSTVPTTRRMTFAVFSDKAEHRASDIT